jgi:hypothetical protein
LTLGSGFVGSAKADLLGSDFLGWRANLRRFPYYFVFRRIDHEVRILVVRYHYRIDLLDP